MYLSRFGVKNYKCLGEIDIPLTPIHVLIGQNDSGKTSLLEAIYAFYASSITPLKEVFPEPWNGRELVCHSSSNNQVELRGEWSSSQPDGDSTTISGIKYGLILEFLLNNKNCFVTGGKGEWLQTSGEEQPLSNIHSDTTSIMRWGSVEEKDFLASDEDIQSVYSVLKHAHKYSLDAKLMAMPAVVDSRRTFRLDSDGFGLATLLNDINNNDPARFLKLRRYFCELFPQFTSVRLNTAQAWKREYKLNEISSTSVTDGTGIFFDTISGHTIRAQQASDGAILFLAFLALAYLPEPPGIILIEEPENGVYPTRLGQIIKLLKDMVHRTDGVRFPQIIMTTHSPYVLSFFEPEEVTLLSRPAEPSDAPIRARPLRDAPNIRERMGNEFYLGELWYNLSEEDLFGDA